MTVNGYKCWSNLCYVIDEVLRGYWADGATAGLVHSSAHLRQRRKKKCYCVSRVWGGLGIVDNPSILSYFRLSQACTSRPCSAALQQRMLLPRRELLQVTSNVNKLWVYFSPRLSLLAQRTAKERIPTLSPETLTHLKRDQRASSSANKQNMKLFSEE